MLSTIAGAAGMFAGTNIDDIIVLTTLFLASAGGSPRPWHIVLGQYLGFSALIGLSVVAALGLAIIPDEWVGLLGAVPLAIGLLGLVRALRRKDEGERKSAFAGIGLAGIIGITVSNGADNIAVYAPVFRTMAPPETVLTILVFLVLVAVWCVLGRLIGTHKKVSDTLKSVEHWLVPSVFIGLGLIILLSSGSLARLIGLTA
ncbi:cadmium resistance transporter [Specibacter cremeus]|uniref:cadmium resistance transporter n=1 Tax=Specibacter cremeus TaxID=1629051 RepID=UPI000F77668B|nr:cadmium resistance transporter [Specibacter cremeus]